MPHSDSTVTEAALKARRRMPVEEWDTEAMTRLKEIESRQRDEYWASDEAQRDLQRWKEASPDPTWEWDPTPPPLADQPVDFLD
jgi:hypothetical protein